MTVSQLFAPKSKGNIGLGLLLLLGVLALGGFAAWFLLRPAAVVMEPDGSQSEVVRETQGDPRAVAEQVTTGTEELAPELGEHLEIAPAVLLLLKPWEDRLQFAVSIGEFSAYEEDSQTRLRVSRMLTHGAVVLADVGQSADAMTVLEEATRFHADQGLPAAWKARLLLRLGKRQEAGELIRLTLEEHPNSVTLLRLAAEVARLDGMDDLGVDYLERALAIDPEASGLADALTRAREEARVMSTFLTDATAHFDLRYDPQERKVVQALPQLGAVVEEAWQDVLAATGLRPQQRVLIMLLEPSRYRSAAPDWSSGLYDGRVRIVVENPAQELEALARTLRHELTHAALFTIGAPLPTWLHEGLAQQVEGGSVEFARRSLGEQGELTLSSAELAGDWTRWQEEDRVREAYFYSLSLSAWLGQEYGGTVWGNLFQNLQGRSFDQAWQLTFGLSFEQINARHRQSLP